MSQTLFGRLVRPAAMFVAGLLAASALSSTVVAAPATVSSTLTRTTSCAGMNFHPIDSRTTYRWDGRSLFRPSKEGDGWFLCDPNLPNRATVTRVRFTLTDASDAINLRYCGLVRAGLGTTGGDPEELGMAVRQTGMSDQPGTVRRSDSSISHATIDETSFAYWLQCQIQFSDDLIATGPDNAGIIGADITYKISSADG